MATTRAFNRANQRPVAERQKQELRLKSLDREQEKQRKKLRKDRKAQEIRDVGLLIMNDSIIQCANYKSQFHRAKLALYLSDMTCYRSV